MPDLRYCPVIVLRRVCQDVALVQMPGASSDLLRRKGRSSSDPSKRQDTAAHHLGVEAAVHARSPMASRFTRSGCVLASALSPKQQ
eukprot:scaffold95504_cov34-Tisochrysis_lutea.AAC.5